MNNRKEIIAHLAALNALLAKSSATISSPENKELRELHANVTKQIHQKFPYSPLDFRSEAF
ncbi:TPA: hypothetical protein L9U77_004989 [Klebsiella pneumoniae]|nr:hypothetical protein [Klebsiella pneumoniae]